MGKTTRNKHGRKSAKRSTAAVAGTDAPELHQVLAVNLSRIRAAKNTSLGALSRKTGYTSEFLDKAEKGEQSTLLLAHVDVLADALGVDVTDLLGPRGLKDE